MRERKPCAPIFFLHRLPSSFFSRAIWSLGHHVDGRAWWQDGWPAVVAGSRSVTNACTCSNGLGYCPSRICQQRSRLSLVSSWACASESIWHHLQQQTTDHRSTDSASPATRRKSGSHPVCSMFIYAGVVYYSLRPALDSRDHLPCFLLWVREREREACTPLALGSCAFSKSADQDCSACFVSPLRRYCWWSTLCLVFDFLGAKIKAPSRWNAHVLRSRLVKRRRQSLKVDTQATVDLYFALHQ